MTQIHVQTSFTTLHLDILPPILAAVELADANFRFSLTLRRQTAFSDRDSTFGEHDSMLEDSLESLREFLAKISAQMYH
jgi:hypothetical protein